MVSITIVTRLIWQKWTNTVSIMRIPFDYSINNTCNEVDMTEIDQSKYHLIIVPNNACKEVDMAGIDQYSINNANTI